MPGQTFTYGELVRISGTFKQNSTLVDPATVTLTIDPAASTELILGSTSWVNDGVGLYHYDFDSTISTGQIEYRWDSLTPQGADESYFIVAVSRVPTP